MKIILALFLLFTNSLQINTDNYEKMIIDLENLENYIKQYITEKSYTSSSLTHLITCYIRLGAYTTTEWTAVGGEIPDDLASYITTKDEENGTSAQATQTYRDTLMPNGESIDFVHMFAVMNGIERGESYTSDAAHLVGWGGDTEQLLEDIMKETGDLEYLMNVAKENYFRVKGGFDEADLVSDLDGAILLYNKNDNNNFADLIKRYYNSNEYKDRVKKFVELTFPGLVNIVDKQTFRDEIFKIYSSNMFIKILECKAGLRDEGLFKCYSPTDIKDQYVENQKAAAYVVSDYFFENYNTSPEPGEEEEEDNEEEKEKQEKQEKQEEKEDEKENEKEDEKENEKENEKEDEKEESDIENKGEIQRLKFISLIYLLLC